MTISLHSSVNTESVFLKYIPSISKANLRLYHRNCYKFLKAELNCISLTGSQKKNTDHSSAKMCKCVMVLSTAIMDEIVNKIRIRINYTTFTISVLLNRLVDGSLFISSNGVLV